MRLTEKQLKLIKIVVIHEMGHYLFGERRRRQRLSKLSLNAMELPTITVNIYRSLKGGVVVDGVCRQKNLTEEDRIFATFGGPAIEFKIAGKRNPNYDNFINKSFLCAYRNRKHDLAKLLHNYTRAEIINKIKELSGLFSHRDLSKIDKFYRRNVLPKIEGLSDQPGKYSLTFKLRDLN